MRESETYPTIRQAAKRGPLSEHYLRLMYARGELPGFHVGKHYRVNYDLLMAQLREKSARAAEGTEVRHEIARTD